jgi:hypothetical protein
LPGKSLARLRGRTAHKTTQLNEGIAFMARDSEHMLHAIERRAECAIVQELRIMLDEVLALRPTLHMDDRAYADGLLMKLDRLIQDQMLPTELELILPAASAA